MATGRVNDRTLDRLYAGLTPPERACLLARLWRTHDTQELNRLLATVPDDRAGAAYNRAVRMLRQLHEATVPTLALLGAGIEVDTWLLVHALEIAAGRVRSYAHVVGLWKLLCFPVTEGEYRGLIVLERSEPLPLDAYAEWLADCAGDEPGLHPDVAALLQALPTDLIRERVPDDAPFDAPIPDEALADDYRRAAEITRRLRRVLARAVRRGELPKPRRTKEGPTLPAGLLHDWGEGTTPETYEPFGPSHHVPALDLLGGGLAGWDVRPDTEVEAVQTRRAELRGLMRDMVEQSARLENGELDGLTLELPATVADRERSARDIEQMRPWALAGEREAVRLLTSRHARRRAELRAYADVIAQFEEEEFGGEDPLDERVRELLGKAWATAEEYAEFWAAVVEVLRPYRLEADQDWPPPLEDQAHYDETRAQVEEHLRGEWDV